LTFAADVDLIANLVDGQEERHVTGGTEVKLGERLAVRGGVGANLVVDHHEGDAQGVFGAAGVSVAPLHRVFVDGAVTWGPTTDRNNWGIDLRVTF
jgi:hypothetical protein